MRGFGVLRWDSLDRRRGRGSDLLLGVVLGIARFGGELLLRLSRWCVGGEHLGGGR